MARTQRKRLAQTLRTGMVLALDFQAATGSLIDKTGRGNNFTRNGTPGNTAGRFGLCADFEADSADQSLLYGSMLWRARQVNPETLMMWGGETDALNGMSQADCLANLITFATAVMADLGLKTMLTLLQNCAGADVTAVNAAIAQAIATRPDLFEAGADLSDMATAPDNFHLKSDAQAATAAARIWAAIKAARGYP